MSASMEVQHLVSAAVNACPKGSNLRLISAWLAIRYDADVGYAEMSSADCAFMGINKRSYWDAVTRLLEGGIWEVEKRSGWNNANRYRPLFAVAAADDVTEGGTGDER